MIVNNVGVATASSRPRSFRDFETQVTEGGDAFVGGLGSARTRLKGIGEGPGVARRQIVNNADDTLSQMQEVASAISSGDSSRAQQLWNQMQNGIGQAFDDSVSERARRIGTFKDQLRHIDVLKSPARENKDIVAVVLGKFSAGDEYEAGRSEFAAALNVAGLSKLKLE